MTKTIQTRVEELSKRGAGVKVIGVLDGDELERGVHITNDDTWITLEEFERLYPDGVLIRLVYDDTPVPE